MVVETRIKKRFKDFVNSMMNDPVSKGCRFNTPELWIFDPENTVFSPSVAFFQKLIAHFKEIGFEIAIEFQDRFTVEFGSCRAVKAAKQFWKCREPFAVDAPESRYPIMRHAPTQQASSQSRSEIQRKAHSVVDPPKIVFGQCESSLEVVPRRPALAECVQASWLYRGWPAPSGQCIQTMCFRFFEQG